MPAVSKSQQAAAAIAREAKKGKIPKSRLRGASKQMAEGMSAEQLGHFAKTKTKDLPTRKEKAAMDIGKIKELLKEAKKGLPLSKKKTFKGGPSQPAAKAPAGEGARFKALTAKVDKPGVEDPKALAAAIGRKKFGKGRFQEMAAGGKKAEDLLGAYADGVFQKCAERGLEFEQALAVWNLLAEEPAE